jgi:dTDP-4-dehydrorhamnose 3,5-epimerase-like enzyme
MKPKLIIGSCHSDPRGSLFYNNDFDSSIIKRIYVIENQNNDLVRQWQGHKIEQRWFSVITGKFKVKLIKIDDWENPSKDLDYSIFIIDGSKLNVLHVPQGYVSSIQSLEEKSKLLVMADYQLGEINDEYKFEVDHFK